MGGGISKIFVCVGGGKPGRVRERDSGRLEPETPHYTYCTIKFSDKK